MLGACVSQSFTDIARPLASNPLASLSELELASYSLLFETSFPFIDFGLRTLRGEDWSVSTFGMESRYDPQTTRRGDFALFMDPSALHYCTFNKKS